MLSASKPRITIKGMEFIEESKPLKKAIRNITDISLNVATGKLSNAIFML